MDENKIYTSLSDIRSELKNRRKDKVLKKKLEAFWGENKPNFIDSKNPKAVFCKTLVTPNFECRYFIDIVKESKIKKEFWQYTSGKFVAKNQEKRHLGKMFFHCGLGKRNGHKLESINLVNFNTEEGKTIKEVKTLQNQSLIDYHHTIFKKTFGKRNKINDISEWFDETRYLTDYYYLYYLSLFIRDYVLFENFIFDEGEESKFSKERFLPSFKMIEELFGVKPLIVPLLPIKNEKSFFWFYYRNDIKKYNKCYTKNKKTICK